SGNGKVDGTPLKCFGKIWYTELVKTIRELLRSSSKQRKGKVSERQDPSNRQSKGNLERYNTPVITEKKKSDDYESTNIGLTFDHEYHGWKRAKSYWKYCQDDEENLTLKEVLKDL
ncbi:MAG: hypothetical protein V1752_00275, partial [Candidatus Firestonebacteria bacterium]